MGVIWAEFGCWLSCACSAAELKPVLVNFFPGIMIFYSFMRNKMKVAFLHPAKHPTVKEILKQYAAYNVWANQRLIGTLLSLPREQQRQSLTSSFGGLHLTLSHMFDAENIWWQRIKLVENAQMPNLDPNKVDEVCAALIGQSKQWEEWVSKATDAALQHEFVYKNSKREQFKQPVLQVLLHLFNHQTYHRGQLVTMLRTLGIETIPSTDFIEFSRRRK